MQTRSTQSLLIENAIFVIISSPEWLHLKANKDDSKQFVINKIEMYGLFYTAKRNKSSSGSEVSGSTVAIQSTGIRTEPRPSEMGRNPICQPRFDANPIGEGFARSFQYQVRLKHLNICTRDLTSKFRYFCLNDDVKSFDS